jgi:hypothetical protein
MLRARFQHDRGGGQCRAKDGNPPRHHQPAAPITEKVYEQSFERSSDIKEIRRIPEMALLFDHLVGAGEDLGRYFDPKRLRRGEIDE